MYDIEKDVENVARAIAWKHMEDDLIPEHIERAWKTEKDFWCEVARAALNASAAVTLLKEVELSLDRYALLLTDAHEDIAIAERRIKELEAMNVSKTNVVELLRRQLKRIRNTTPPKQKD